MSNEKDSTNAPPLAEEVEDTAGENGKAEKPRVNRGVWFGFVAQADISEQMDVVRWLRKDMRYRVCSILHDRDTYAEDDKAVKKGDAKVGERKGDHWHGIVRVPGKISAQSLAKRFGNYLHFELLSDPQEYAYYMLHETFNAKKAGKTPYKSEEVQDDVRLFWELTNTRHTGDICEIIRDIAETRDENGEINPLALIEQGNLPALKSLMSHSYFYATFIQKTRKGGK